MSEEESYQVFKKLRNHLRQINVENALYVIWTYLGFFQFKTKFPRDIEVHKSIIYAPNIPSRGIQEWELATLAREVIANGEIYPSATKKDLRRWQTFAAFINALKDFEGNFLSGQINAENFPKEFRRMAHRQFKWQSKPTLTEIVRYYKVFNNPRVQNYVVKHIGLTTQQWYIIGTALLGTAMTAPKHNIDPEIKIAGMIKDDFDKFVKQTALDLLEMQKLIREKVPINEEFLYATNPLEFYPLVKIGRYFYCPIINFLLWRLTSGLYFNLVGDKNFGKEFGLAFQDYLTEVSDVILDKDIQIVKEQKYLDGKEEKDTVDIILSQKGSAFFVEAKAKRLKAKSKSQILTSEAIDEDLDVMADAVVQVYISIEEYKKNLYPNFSYVSTRDVFPIIVTLEEWYVFGEEYRTLLVKIKSKLKEKGISEHVLEQHPFTITSVEDYEFLLQVLKNHKISEVVKDWVSFRDQGHHFGNHVKKSYVTELKTLDEYFREDFKKIYPEGMIKDEDLRDDI